MLLPARSQRSLRQATFRSIPSCGVIDTEMNACFAKEELAALTEEIPAGRFGTPEEVAALALQLCAAGSYLTGQIITLDGGFT